MKQVYRWFGWSAGFFLAGVVSVTPMTAQDKLVVDSLIQSNRAGLENSLTGTVAGLRVKTWTGTAGAQSTLNVRGLSLDPTGEATQPLILINGVPILSSPSQVSGINPLSYYSPDQIDHVEVIKSIDLLAAYGVQAPNGAINLVMKEGKNGPLHVRATASAGVNYLNDISYRKDAFYGFNTIGRRDVYRHGGIVHDQNVLVDGGGDYGSYLFGLNNHQDKGVMNGTSFDRQSLFLNAHYTISPKLKAHFYNNLALSGRDGRYAGEYQRALPLPVISDEAFFMDKRRNMAFLSSVGLSYQLAPDLTLSSVAGLSYEGASRDMYIPSNILRGSIYASSEAQKSQLIDINTSLHYNRQLTADWKMDLKLGHELRTTDHRLTAVDGSRSLESGGSNYVKVVTGYNANQTQALSDHRIERLIGFYGIGKWSHRDDLQLNLVLRTDGSSLYDQKWGFYPAAGVVYNLADKLNIPLKLNASAGKTGMLNRPEVYRGELIGKGDYFSGNQLGVGQLYAAFRDARSVDVYQLDAGVSAELTPYLSLGLDYFMKSYQGFAYRRYLPNIQGLEYAYETGGQISLSGFELTLNGDWLRGERFSWSTNLNLAAYNNRVNDLPEKIGETSLVHLAALSKGDPVTSLVAYESGREKVVGNMAPALFGGLTNVLRFHSFSAGFTVAFSSASDVLAESFGSRYLVGEVGDRFPVKANETPYYFVEGSERAAAYQGIRTIENGGFLRLSRAELGYSLGEALKESLSISDLRLFVRGENLLTLSKYSGINPEENLTGIRKTDLSLTGTPLPASVALGLKLVF